MSTPFIEITEGGGGSSDQGFATDIPSDPSAEIPFEVIKSSVNNTEGQGDWWSFGDVNTADRFIPTYYPDNLRINREKEMERTPHQCGGEDVSIKHRKNTEIHVQGVVRADNIGDLFEIVGSDDTFDVVTPIFPDSGMECFIISSEMGNLSGWDPHFKEWLFEYSLDFLSTGADEYGSENNPVVTDTLNLLD